MSPRATRDRTAGYSLIELLVVLGILVVVAGIAIPFFLEQRRAAWASAAESDLRNAVMTVEPLTDSSGAPDALAADPAARTVEFLVGGTSLTTTTLSPGVTLTLDCEDDPDRTCLCADHEHLDGTVVAYDSASPGLRVPGLLDLDCATGSAEQVILTSHFSCDDGRCTYNEQNGDNDAGRQLFDVDDVSEVSLTDGSLLLRNAQFAEDASGWAITYGVPDGNGRISTGYTLQIDPGADGFVIRSWDAGGRHDYRLSPQRADFPDGFDPSAPSDIEASVSNGTISLSVNGTEYLSYQMGSSDQDRAVMGDQPGVFGIRAWDNHGDDQQVTFDDPPRLIINE